jgi:hypothetical protein
LVVDFEQRKNPSALGKFEQIASASQGKKIVMFIDYDGTLSPIVADPDAAYMSDAVRIRPSFHGRSNERRKSSISADVFLPLRCSSSTDEDGGARRRKAVPDGDRQRPEPRQGTLAEPFASEPQALEAHMLMIWFPSFSCAAGAQLRRPLGALLRRQPRHGHQGTRL